MPLQEAFYQIVSGRKTGIAAALMRSGLRLLEMPYRTCISIRNALYDRSLLPTRRFSLPIISVGNLTLGGTGKSPMTAWLCRYLEEQNLQAGLISRGYAKGNHEGNDEFMEMSYRFPNLPHIQNPNRGDAVQQLLQRGKRDVILLDDAFQHRQLCRTIDIVLLDATSPFGFGHVFPRGTLREPVESLCRADIVLLTRSDLIDEKERESIHQQVLAAAPNILWGETIHAPASLVSLSSDAPTGKPSFYSESIDSLAGMSALACCGIGNPAAFRKTLEQCGVHVKKLIPFPDHYRYTADDVRHLIQTAKEQDAEIILCTMKDLVKLTELPSECFYHCCVQHKTIKRATSGSGKVHTPLKRDREGFPIKAVSIEIQFIAGEAAVREKLTFSSSQDGS